MVLVVCDTVCTHGIRYIIQFRLVTKLSGSFFLFFLPYFFLHRLENRMEPISTPYDGRR